MEQNYNSKGTIVNYTGYEDRKYNKVGGYTIGSILTLVLLYGLTHLGRYSFNTKQVISIESYESSLMLTHINQELF